MAVDYNEEEERIYGKIIKTAIEEAIRDENLTVREKIESIIKIFTLRELFYNNVDCKELQKTLMDFLMEYMDKDKLMVDEL